MLHAYFRIGRLYIKLREELSDPQFRTMYVSNISNTRKLSDIIWEVLVKSVIVITEQVSYNNCRCYSNSPTDTLERQTASILCGAWLISQRSEI